MNLPVGVDFAARVALLFFALLALYRVAFWAVFRDTARRAEPSEVRRAFGIGLRFDLRLALLVALPVLALSWLPAAGPAPFATGWHLLLGLAWLTVTAVHLADLAHYGYLHRRIDATIVEHLAEPGAALRSAGSLPVLRGLLALLAASAIHAMLLENFVLETFLAREAASALPLSPGRAAPLAPAGLPWLAPVAWAAALALLLLGLHGRLAKSPLRWSDAYFSTSPFVSALGLQPVLVLASTWRGRRSGADVHAAATLQPELARMLGVARPDLQPLDLSRPQAPRAAPARPRHVVIVVVESLAGYRTGALGNPLDPTPFLDALARESLLCTHAFAVTAPASRALFSLLAGIPDVNPAQPASRNPLLVRQSTLLNAFTDHDKHVFVGGSADRDNLRGLLAHNVPGILIHDELEHGAPRVDGRGISDRALLAAAVKTFDAATRPFVAVVHASGGERPVPADRGDFRLRHEEPEALRRAGFDSLAGFNGLRFLDHSLHAFFAAARARPWYRDTVFLVLGGHGASAPCDTPWERLGLTRLHVPLLLHGPGLGRPRRLDGVASSLDVLPTALSLAGIPCVNATLGRDLLDAGTPGERCAFVQHLPWHGVITDEFLLRLHPDGRSELFRHRSEQPLRELSAELPAEAARLTRLCRAWLHTSRLLLRRGLRAPPQEGEDEARALVRHGPPSLRPLGSRPRGIFP
jgi:phosphoglycerol transferase MdoB-like AlkP superfamily enzyme